MAKRVRLQPFIGHADNTLQEWLPDSRTISALQKWLHSAPVQARHGNDPGRHPVPIIPARWSTVAAGRWPQAFGTDSTQMLISRRDLFDLAAETHPSNSWIPLLAASYAWGHDLDGYGPARLQKILTANDLTDIDRALTEAVDALRAAGAVAAYQALNRRIRHLGPAFFTKVLYAAGQGLGVEGPRPLILDKRVAVSLRTLATRVYRHAGLPSDLASWLWTDNGWSPARYGQYVGSPIE